MSERVLAALLASLALMTGGCGGGSEPTAQAPATPGGATPSPSPAAQKPSVPAKPADAKDAKDAKGKPDAPATAKGPNGKSPAVAGGLTRSTDPDERAQEVQGRIKAGGAAKTDPFSALPVTPVLKADSEGAAAGNSSIAKAGGAATAAEARAGSGGLTSSDTANGGSAGASDESATPATLVLLPPLPPIAPQGAEPVADMPPLFVPPNQNVMADLPSLDDVPGLSPAEPALALPPLNSQPVAALPPLPVNIGPALPPEGIEPPAVSETIQVTGVAQLGNSVQVIVQLPGGQTRYVAVGDLIANGQVLVKRVEGLGTGDPIVILEEEGVEYDRAVGAPPIMAMEDSNNS
jgi:hypothetical protein